MFFHIFKYRIKALVRNKEELFWTIMFPLILGTCFYFAFADITEKTENFKTINVAVVSKDVENNMYFDAMMDSLSSSLDGETAFFSPEYTSYEEAEKMLSDGKVAGIIQMKDGTPYVTVSKNGITETMIKSVMDRYAQTVRILSSVSPEKIQEVAEIMNDNASHIHENQLTDGNADNTLDYFYSLISMACMFGCITGQLCATHIKANLSSVGMRKSLSSRSRFSLVIGEMTGSYTIHLAGNILLIVYLKYILRINLGVSFIALLAVMAVGSLIALSTGVLIGSIPKLSENTKMGINIAFSLVASFLSGLMVGGVKQSVERHLPVLNRINPATLISDALYSLNIYDTYDVFLNRMLIMLCMTAVFLTIVFFMVRREKYDNV